MYERLKQDLYSEQKERDTLTVSVVRCLSSAIKNKEIELRTSGEALNEEHILKIIKKQIKQRIESSEGFTKVGRSDDAARELGEKALLEKYLPQETQNA